MSCVLFLVTNPAAVSEKKTKQKKTQQQQQQNTIINVLPLGPFIFPGFKVVFYCRLK